MTESTGPTPSPSTRWVRNGGHSVAIVERVYFSVRLNTHMVVYRTLGTKTDQSAALSWFMRRYTEA